MTSRERVMRALNHQQPDRAPIDLGATRQSGIAASACYHLKERLNIHTPTRVVDLTQFLAEVEQPILDRFGVDAVGVFRPETNPGMPIRRENWKPWRLFDGAPVEVPGAFNPVVDPDGGYTLFRDGVPIARMPKDGFYFDRLEKFPGAAHIDVDKWEPHHWTNEESNTFISRRNGFMRTPDTLWYVVSIHPRNFLHRWAPATSKRGGPRWGANPSTCEPYSKKMLASG